MISVTINDRETRVASGSTILEAAGEAGVHIPTLCHLEGRSPLGACRVCVVEVEGAKTLMAACATPASDGMKVRTNTGRVRSARPPRMAIRLGSGAVRIGLLSPWQNASVW